MELFVFRPTAKINDAQKKLSLFSAPTCVGTHGFSAVYRRFPWFKNATVNTCLSATRLIKTSWISQRIFNFLPTFVGPSSLTFKPNPSVQVKDLFSTNYAFPLHLPTRPKGSIINKLRLLALRYQVFRFSSYQVDKNQRTFSLLL